MPKETRVPNPASDPGCKSCAKAIEEITSGAIKGKQYAGKVKDEQGVPRDAYCGWAGQWPDGYASCIVAGSCREVAGYCDAPVGPDGKDVVAHCKGYVQVLSPLRVLNDPSWFGVCLPDIVTVTPCPTPPPPPQPGLSDVAKIALFHYDDFREGCKIQRQPFVVPNDPPCHKREIHVTLTPKADQPCAVDNCDAQHHGRAVTWWAATDLTGAVTVPDDGEVVVPGCAVVGSMATEPTFNRFIRAIGLPCSFRLGARLTAPDGKMFEVEKVVSVQ